MKKNKIIGLLIACGGVVASFAAAFALSTKNAEDVHFNITAKSAISDDGGIEYSIPAYDSTHAYLKEYVSTNGSLNDGVKFDETYTQLHYAFKLGGSYVDAIAQDYVVGNLSFTFSNINASILNHAKINVIIRGYSDNTVGKDVYENIFWPANDTPDSTIALENEQTTFVVQKDVAVACDGTQYADVYIKLDANRMNEILYACDEESPFDLDIVWGEPSSAFAAPIIRGDGNGWATTGKYMMVPNINKASNEGWQWYFKGLHDFELLKLYMNDEWIGANDGGTGTATPGSNITGIDKTVTYNVYWDGQVGDGHPVTFYPPLP